MAARWASCVLAASAGAVAFLSRDILVRWYNPARDAVRHPQALSLAVVAA
jgi:hypothetical protein